MAEERAEVPLPVVEVEKSLEAMIERSATRFAKFIRLKASEQVISKELALLQRLVSRAVDELLTAEPLLPDQVAAK